MISEEVQKRFLLLLASTYLKTDCRKKHILDTLIENDWVSLESEDLVMKKKPKELVWRNNFAFVKKHLSMEGYYSDKVYDSWEITERGLSYLYEIYDKIDEACDRGIHLRWITPKAVSDASLILSRALIDQTPATKSGSNSLQSGRSRRKGQRVPLVPTKTERLAIIKARFGQVYFKKKLLELDDRCRLCGLSNKKLLVASHIKPWAKSNPEERLSPDNGFLLCPLHDSLFDKFLISFQDDGTILLSRRLTEEDRAILHLNGDLRITLTKGNLPYLKWHRATFFRQNMTSDEENLY